MSAREKLLSMCVKYQLYFTEEVFEPLLDAYRDEVLHEAAKRIERENPDRSPDWSDGAEWAADLIDPEVTDG